MLCGTGIIGITRISRAQHAVLPPKLRDPFCRHQEPSLCESDNSLPRISIGICAMEKKARSKPMAAIIERLTAFGEFDVEVFGDDVTLNKPVTEWPLCDVLLSWHSDGFPLEKVCALHASQYRPATLTVKQCHMLLTEILRDTKQGNTVGYV